MIRSHATSAREASLDTENANPSIALRWSWLSMGLAVVTVTSLASAAADVVVAPRGHPHENPDRDRKKSQAATTKTVAQLPGNNRYWTRYPPPPKPSRYTTWIDLRRLSLTTRPPVTSGSQPYTATVIRAGPIGVEADRVRSCCCRLAVVCIDATITHLLFVRLPIHEHYTPALKLEWRMLDSAVAPARSFGIPTISYSSRIASEYACRRRTSIRSMASVVISIPAHRRPSFCAASIAVPHPREDQERHPPHCS